METHIARHRNPKTKKPQHRDSKSKKPRHRDSGIKHQDIEKQRQLIHDIVIIPSHFFRRQKASTSGFQDWKTTISSFCEILTIVPPNRLHREIKFFPTKREIFRIVFVKSVYTFSLQARQFTKIHFVFEWFSLQSSLTVPILFP